MIEISEQTARIAVSALELTNGKTGADKVAIGTAQAELEAALAEGNNPHVILPQVPPPNRQQRRAKVKKA